MSARHAAGPRPRGWTAPGALRVPQIGALFWVVKALSTALGESTSDFSVHAFPPVLAVIGGFIAFVAVLLVQLRQRRYRAWSYWLAVCAVGVFGTMAADVMHVVIGVPYPLSSALYAVLLAAVFIGWARTEHTLSIHRINTLRRELFYWAAVVATFAMGTAVGDFTAYDLHLGYLTSGIVFLAALAVPAAGYRFGGWNPIATFWAAYIITRPVGASFADYFGKPTSYGGLGFGSGRVALVLAAAIACLVGYLAVSRVDVQPALRERTRRRAAPALSPEEG